VRHLDTECAIDRLVTDTKAEDETITGRIGS
jgi:hypothetical protein